MSEWSVDFTPVVHGLELTGAPEQVSKFSLRQVRQSKKMTRLWRFIVIGWHRTFSRRWPRGGWQRQIRACLKKVVMVFQFKPLGKNLLANRS
jgi:hypothetical protein